MRLIPAHIAARAALYVVGIALAWVAVEAADSGPARADSAHPPGTITGLLTVVDATVDALLPDPHPDHAARHQPPHRPSGRDPKEPVVIRPHAQRPQLLPAKVRPQPRPDRPRLITRDPDKRAVIRVDPVPSVRPVAAPEVARQTADGVHGAVGSLAPGLDPLVGWVLDLTLFDRLDTLLWRSATLPERVSTPYLQLLGPPAATPPTPQPVPARDDCCPAEGAADDRADLTPLRASADRIVAGKAGTARTHHSCGTRAAGATACAAVLHRRDATAHEPAPLQPLLSAIRAAESGPMIADVALAPDWAPGEGAGHLTTRSTDGKTRWYPLPAVRPA